MKETVNIFNSIVCNENTFTELLVNMLGYKTFRDLFIKFALPSVETKNITHSNISTQVSYGNNRPDIVICTDEYEIFIEIKTSNTTTLTNNQPENYYKTLVTSKAKFRALVFLHPNNYNHLDNYTERLEKVKKHTTENDIYTNELTWSNFYDKIIDAELNIWNPIIQEFCNLLQDWFIPKKITITNSNLINMFTTETAKTIRKIIEIVDQIGFELPKNNIEITKKRKEILHEYGFYIKSKTLEKSSIFVGLWFPYWEKVGEPFCLSINTNSTPKELTIFSQRCIEESLNKPSDFGDGWYTTYFNQVFIAENSENNIAMEITNIVQNILA
jgi:hypothetical protein